MQYIIDIYVVINNRYSIVNYEYSYIYILILWISLEHVISTYLYIENHENVKKIKPIVTLIQILLRH